MFWPVPQSSLLMQPLQAGISWVLSSYICGTLPLHLWYSPVTPVVSSAVSAHLLCVTGGHLTSSSSQNRFKHNRYCMMLDCVKHWTLHTKPDRFLEFVIGMFHSISSERCVICLKIFAVEINVIQYSQSISKMQK